MMFGGKKTRMAALPEEYTFIRYDIIHERDRHTDRHRMMAKTGLDASIARQKRERGTSTPKSNKLMRWSLESSLGRIK